MKTPFVISRLLKAPRQLVWEAYTRPEHLQHWFGPKGSTVTHSQMDWRDGGSYHYAMTTAEGQELWGKWQLRAIVPPEKLELIQHFSDPQGGVTRNPWTVLWPLYTLSTTTFTEEGSNTRLTIEWAAYNATPEEEANFAASHAGMQQGWGGSLDVLADYLSLQDPREIVMSRTVRAPRAKVWAAMTDPTQVVHWWGPTGFTTQIEEMDVRVGGQWKHTMVGPDGTRYPNRSVFREVVPNERIVYTHGGGKEHSQGAHFTATWTFDEVPEGTRVTIRMVFDSADERNFVVREYGAIDGGYQTLNRLDSYLHKD